MKRLKFALFVFFLVSIAWSCSSFKETHYFKDKPYSNNSVEEDVPNYFKVNITGFTFLSSSRYVSGYFDPTVVSLYFNEFKQPAEGRIFTVADPDGGNGSIPIPNVESGSELVLLLSSNSKSVMDQIGNLSKNQEILNSLASITQKKEIDESLEIQKEINLLNTENEFFKKIIDSGITEITAEIDPEKKKERLSNLIRNLRLH